MQGHPCSPSDIRAFSDRDCQHVRARACVSLCVCVCAHRRRPPPLSLSKYTHTHTHIHSTEAEQVLALLRQVTTGERSITGLASDSIFNKTKLCTFTYETTSTYELTTPFCDDDGGGGGGGIRTPTHIQTLNGGNVGGGLGTINPPSWSFPPEIRVLDPIQGMLAFVAIAFLILLMGSAVMVGRGVCVCVCVCVCMCVVCTYKLTISSSASMPAFFISLAHQRHKLIQAGNNKEEGTQQQRERKKTTTISSPPHQHIDGKDLS